MAIEILNIPVDMDHVRTLAQEWYGTMLKGAVDIARKKVALGGDYHIESCEKLVADGSRHPDVWGFNIRFEEDPKGALEFDSLINIKPALGNRTRTIDDAEIIKKATEIIESRIFFKN